MTAVRLAVAREARGRDVTRRDGNAPDWDGVVKRLLGPVVTPADRERLRADALALAEAAMRVAGEKQG